MKTSILLSLFALISIVTCASSDIAEDIEQDVKKRSIDDDGDSEEFQLENEADDDTDKRSRLFRYGRGTLFRYGKRAPVFRYGKRAPVFRYGKRDYDESVEGSDDFPDYVKRLFRWGKRSFGEDDDQIKRAVFRYGKRAPEDAKRRVFRFGKRADLADEYKYGRDTRVPDQPHVPFRFGDE